jgi:hypothetical protein
VAPTPKEPIGAVATSNMVTTFSAKEVIATPAPANQIGPPQSPNEVVPTPASNYIGTACPSEGVLAIRSYDRRLDAEASRRASVAWERAQSKSG